jgi:hypothetical protein
VTIDDLVAGADFDTTFTLGPCAICGTATYCGARIPRGWPGERFIYLCFREHRNPEGLRMALEKEKGDDSIV